MLRSVVTTAFALGFFALSASPANADEPSYVEEAVQGLQGESYVYVSPSVHNVSGATIDSLTSVAQAEDIGIAVLPAQAAHETGESVTEFMRQVTVRTDHDTVVVVVGNDLEAGSRVLDQGVAGQLANEAEQNSSSTDEALIEFVNAVASQEHTSKSDTPSSDGGGLPFVPIGIAVVVLAALVVAGKSAYNKFTHGKEREQSPSFKNSPRTVREELQRIVALLPAVNNKQMSRTLLDGVNNTNAFFVRAEKKMQQQLADNPDAAKRQALEDKARKDADNISKLVSMLYNMLDTYLDAQENPRFYDSPDELIATGAQAASDYDEYIIGCIRSNTTLDAFEFDKATRMIEANRSRYGKQ